MISLFLALAVFLASGCSPATAIDPVAVTPDTTAISQDHFPGEEWQHASDSLQNRWDADALNAVNELARQHNSKAYMVIHHGWLIDSYGDIQDEVIVQSVRKSFLSALYGPAVASGAIDLDDTLANLGINDLLPLSLVERSATVRQLLQARSGVYHPAAASPPSMSATLPDRGAHAPGTFWLYNNWDFNALGTIYNQQTGSDIYEDFERLIARPTGMQDFTESDGQYYRESMSEHPAYHFNMSARDMARFGLLMLRDGQWNGEQILPAGWVAESTQEYSDADVGGYGYMWWTGIPGVPRDMESWAARGGGGHMILVVPELDLVFVHRVHMDRQHSANWTTVVQMVNRVVQAHPDSQDPVNK
jgi:CubicO group peptidase (beta-lactamase class C family)